MEHYGTEQDSNGNEIVLMWDGENESSVREETGDERWDRLRREGVVAKYYPHLNS